MPPILKQSHYIRKMSDPLSAVECTSLTRCLETPGLQ